MSDQNGSNQHVFTWLRRRKAKPERRLAFSVLALCASLGVEAVWCSNAAAQFTDTFNARYYGEIGTGSTATIGTTYGTSPSALAAYTNVQGQTPYSWATNPLFGLTFPMTTSATQAGAGAPYPLTFSQAALTAGNLPWRSSGMAQWASPEHAYEYVRPGMLVTGADIPSGATVGSVEAAPVRMSELLPNCTEWAPNTAYAVNACAEFSGVAAWATTPGTSGSGTAFPLPNTTGNYTTLVTSATSGTVGDGSVTWTIKQRVGYIQWPTGRIFLANDSGQTTAVPSDTVVTFTESPAQIEAHTVDWLALQAAVGNAWLSNSSRGAEAHWPACVCYIDRPIYNPGVINTSTNTPNVSIRGDGTALTAIYQTQNFGYGFAAISESNLTQSASQSQYSDFSLRGSTGDPGIFGFTAYTNNGIQVGADARLIGLTSPTTSAASPGRTIIRNFMESLRTTVTLTSARCLTRRQLAISIGKAAQPTARVRHHLAFPTQIRLTQRLS